MDSASSNPLVPILATTVSIAVVVAATTGVWFLSSKTKPSQKETTIPSVVDATKPIKAVGLTTHTSPSTTTTGTGTTTAVSNSSSNSRRSTNSELKNVWDAPRNLTSRSKVAHSKTKKFSSSYYYAHNNPNAIGGYKDGLQMEDYTMNQPRLLTKGGKPVTGVPQDDDNDNNDNDNASSNNDDRDDDPCAEARSSTNTNTNTNTKPTKPIRQITKYLWDDPGDHQTGVATIRIDCLPHWKDSTQLVNYKDAEVTSAQSTLLEGGNGLKLKVESSQASYELCIPKFHGDVASIKLIQKPNKLLIKLTKKKSTLTKTGLWGSSSSKDLNLNSWPGPGRKVLG